MVGKNIERHVTITERMKEGDIDYSNNLREFQMIVVDQAPSGIQPLILETLINIAIKLPESNEILKERGNIERINQGLDMLDVGKLTRRKWKRHKSKENSEIESKGK